MNKIEKLIDVIIVEPGKKPYSKSIDNTLEALQKCIGGLIEVIYNSDDTLIICNEEGKINGMKPNRYIENDIIAGTFLICGDGGEIFRSLTDSEKNKYMNKFNLIPDITPSNIEQFIYINI